MRSINKASTPPTIKTTSPPYSNISTTKHTVRIPACPQHLQSIRLTYRDRIAEMPLTRADFDNAAVRNVQNPSQFGYHHDKHHLCVCDAYADTGDRTDPEPQCRMGAEL